MKYSYQKICQELISDLPQRQKEVLLRRFALGTEAKERETLEVIGQDFGITRERVRQIEEDGLARIKPKIKNYLEVFQSFKNYLQNAGGLRKEEAILADFGSVKERNQIYFLLTIAEGFERLGGSEDFQSFWAINGDSFGKAKRTIDLSYQALGKGGKPLALKELMKLSGSNTQKLSQDIFASYLEISKKIQKSAEGLFGLKDWPEINPRGVKDKIYLTFKKENKPLHFRQLAQLIQGSLVQTVHNELIRDPRFILIGRGIYALGDWGYHPGQVKDVILRIFKEEKRPLSKDEIFKRVQKQRIVKANTIFLNLSNKKYFSRDSQGKYFINTA